MHSYREKVTPTHVLWETKGIKKTAPSFDKNEFENLYKLPAPVAGGGHIMVRGGVCWGGGGVRYKILNAQNQDFPLIYS